MPTLFPKDNRAVQAEIPPSGFAGKSRSNRFAFQLFAALASGKENLAICPYGARILLSLLWSGASGETRRQMGSVLELEDGQDGNETGMSGRDGHWE
jgi:serine protease inhibitor